ncbi:MAG: hypothetical protein E7356_00145 [Clostridiales bacterium]|nr:hypothetical protein [Clostridiales bacterium]
MAVYSTKTNKLNQKRRRISIGTSLILIFSVLLALVAFDLFEIFTIIVLGSIGLLFYPICLFLITIGILICANKPIRASKSLTISIVIWLILFVLLLQMITSKSMDQGFVDYITNTFKHNITAGGVVFGVMIYPLYWLTHSVATYIILSIGLVIATAFLIDRIRVDFITHKTSEIIRDTSDIRDNDIEYEDIDEEEELALASNITDAKPDIDDDIFIDDEDEIEDKKERTIRDLDSIAEASNVDDEEEFTPTYTHFESSVTQKPEIIVHEDPIEMTSSTTIENKVSRKEKIKEDKKKIEELKNEERKKAALDYLNITKGKFQSNTNMPKGLDNVSNEVATTHTVNNVTPQTQPQQTNSTPTQSMMQEQTSQNTDRINRLSNLSEKINLFESRMKADNNERKDIFDPNLTKDNYRDSAITESQQITIPNLTSSFNSMPRKAAEVYNGNVNENIVDARGPRPVQVPMEPIAKPKPKNLYKAPPAVYNRPPIDLLSKYATQVDSDEQYMQERADRIVETLSNFKINTRVINATKGPTFTRYELQMAPGISVSTINPRINDLSMALESRCRVQVPIPNKNAFGIEVPNKKRVTVGLRDIIESSNFQNSKSPLTIALGKDISNDCKVACIDKLVHTLVAGSTGSGKSVCLHTMLISLLYKAAPDELKLLLVDPKTVEFTMYNHLPHMLIPTAITECDKAVSALGWLVDEMERRYKRLSSVSARNIEGYNESPEVISGQLPKMYYIVMVFDEVGDYMAVAKKEIEEKIVRLAAKSRAAGIHLILTTQRPTTDVITGTIKTNLPSRIAFAVNSYIDSKTIIDTAGAESLLGMGDMLFLPKGSNDTERIQCAYVKDQELLNVVKYIKDNNDAEFDDEIVDQMFNKKDGFDPTSGSAEDQFDPMLKDCLKFFIKSKRASASSLQSYFAMGYPKASKIVMQMEKAGFISPGDHNGRRQLYITEQEFEERFGEGIDE